MSPETEAHRFTVHCWDCLKAYHPLRNEVVSELLGGFSLRVADIFRCPEGHVTEVHLDGLGASSDSMQSLEADRRLDEKS